MMPDLVAKYGKKEQTGMPDIAAKYGKQESPKLTQLRAEQVQYDQRAKQANSIGGLLKNTLKGIPAAAGTMARGIVNADVGQAFGNTNLNATRAGIMANTALGIPKAAKEVFMPNRGFTDTELKNARPGVKDVVQAPGRLVAEISSGLGQLPGLIPGYDRMAQKIVQTPVGSKLADAGQAIQDFGVPKTPEQAQAMRFGDVAQILPIGSIKRVATTGVAAAKAYQGEKVLTTKLLKDLEGKSTVSKQYILDATNRPELKQAERELFRKLVQEEGDVVNVPAFAAKVKKELLPLKRDAGATADGYIPRYENVTLPDNTRGPVANYSENIYESPIKTSAGSSHFGDRSNSYFAHSRIEDLPPPVREMSKGMRVDPKDFDEELSMAKKKLEDAKRRGNEMGIKQAQMEVDSMADLPSTRRVIEIQSDLFQKGRLESEMPSGYGYSAPEITRVLSPEDAKAYQEALRTNRESNVVMSSTRFSEAEKAPIRAARATIDRLEKIGVEALNKTRKSELSKLEPYRNTWHERVIREEVKKAAQDGKTKLQFPTGETAMKIEGLVNRSDKWVTLDNIEVNGTNIKDGDFITYQTHEGTPHPDRRFLVTKNNGDGTFEAVDSLTAENDSELYKLLERNDLLDDGRMPSLEELESVHGLNAFPAVKNRLKQLAEQLSAKDTVDTNNPIYKFYEKEVGKYLTNKYGAKRVKDAQGVEWYEIPVDKKQATMPVEAYGMGAGLSRDEEGNYSFDPMSAAMGVAGVGMLKKGGLGKIDSAHQGSLATAEKFRQAAFANLKKAREAVKNAPLGQKAARRMEVLKAESKHNEALQMVSDAKTQLNNRAQELGMTTENAPTYGINGGDIGFTSRSERSRQKGIDTYLEANRKLDDYVGPPPTPPKQISELDRLIADGKIRVTSRNGYDVFQVKKGKHWMNTRDQYSAIDQVTREPKPKAPRVEAPRIQALKDKVEEARTNYEIGRDTLSDMPGGQLLKYRSPETGDLPEMVGKVVSGRKLDIKGKGRDARLKFAQKGDDIVQDLLGRELTNGGDLDIAQEYLDDYVKMAERVDEAKRQYQLSKKELAAARKAPRIEQTPVAKIESAPRPLARPALETMSEGEARSLEIVANQSLKAANLGGNAPGASLEAIVRKMPTPVNKKITLLDYMRTPDRVLKKIGLGKEAEMLHENYDAYLRELPKNIDKITEWSKQVGKLGNERIFKYLDGQAIDLNPAEQKVANEIKVWLKDWAKRLKLPEDKQISHYITHIFDDQLVAKEFDEDLAKIIADKIPGSVYDPFLEKRLGAKGYRQDTWAALDAYAKRATRKVHMDPVLERLEEVSGVLEDSQWRYIKRYADNVNMRPSHIDNLLDNSIKNIIGYRLGQRPTARITQGLRRLTYRAMLGLNPSSALRNLSQGANTYAKLGEKYTTIGYAKLFTPGARKELIEQGVLNSGFIQDRALSAAKKAMERADKGLFAFFDGAEMINRGAAYHGAKAKALAAGKTEAEAIKYAKQIVRDTQFAFGSVDTPVGFQSDLAKTFLQFKSYSTKQAEFLAEMAKNKEFAGLIRYGVAGLTFVYTVGEAFGMEPSELIPFYRDLTDKGIVSTPPSLKVPAEIMKGVLNVPDKYGNIPDTKKKFENIGKAVLTGMVPGGTQINKTLQGYDAVQSGASVTNGGQVQFKVGGTPAKDAQALLFGKYANQEAKDYYDKVPTPEKKKAQEVYAEVQRLKETDYDAAKAMVDALTDEEYEEYKKVRAAEKRKATIEGEKAMFPTVRKVQQLVAEGREDEARAIVNAMTDEEYRLYKLAKEKLQ